ncbi:RNA 2',3'-cyclic phosphodiesterase [bacterium]|nr:RNA 2',3'-cyclic phosphodiesterase [bacterium]
MTADEGRLRLFVAVNPPRRFREDLDTRLDRIRDQVRIAWTRPPSWHLTLAFLGDWPAERRETLRKALWTRVCGHEPFLLRPGGVGAFPSLRRPRVLFLHTDGGDPLQALANDVRDAADRAWPDGPQDHKDFRPHLTLARIKRPLQGAEPALLRTLDLGAWDPFPVERVQLMASERRPDGARYTVVDDVPLGVSGGR